MTKNISVATVGLGSGLENHTSSFLTKWYLHFKEKCPNGAKKIWGYFITHKGDEGLEMQMAFWLYFISSLTMNFIVLCPGDAYKYFLFGLQLIIQHLILVTCQCWQKNKKKHIKKKQTTEVISS